LFFYYTANKLVFHIGWSGATHLLAMRPISQKQQENITLLAV